MGGPSLPPRGTPATKFRKRTTVWWSETMGGAGREPSPSLAERPQGLVSNPGQLQDLTTRIAAKALSPVELVQSCLERIEQVDHEWR